MHKSTKKRKFIPKASQRKGFNNLTDISHCHFSIFHLDRTQRLNPQIPPSPSRRVSHAAIFNPLEIAEESLNMITANFVALGSRALVIPSVPYSAASYIVAQSATTHLHTHNLSSPG